MSNKFKVDIDEVTDVSGKAVPSDYTTSVVIIVHDNGTAGLMDKAMRAMNVDKRQITDGSKNWVAQIRNTMVIGEVDDDEDEIDELDQEGPTLGDAILWFIALPFEVIFAIFIPPVEYCGGGLTFVTSLIGIGGVTVFVGDLAYLFGCVLDLPISFTAITFVALGTSLPDTFASRGAALHDSNADASIGNWLELRERVLGTRSALARWSVILGSKGRGQQMVRLLRKKIVGWDEDQRQRPRCADHWLQIFRRSPHLPGGVSRLLGGSVLLLRPCVHRSPRSPAALVRL